MKKNLVVGSTAFVEDSQVYGVITDKTKCGICQILIPSANEVLVRDISLLSPLASDSFNIGDKVKSLLGGGFQGYVVGFEQVTNRIICISENQCPYNNSKKDRVRYSYKINEIEPVPDTFQFEVGCRYRLPDGTRVFVTQSSIVDNVCLILTTGEIYVIAKKSMSMKEACRRGFAPIEKLNFSGF